MEKITIQFTLFSAFYAPLIATMSGGFLKGEGLEPDWSVAPVGTTAIKTLEAGGAEVVQSALSQGLAVMDRGKRPASRHFAQVNEMDGFFVTGREADPNFQWSKLEGAKVVLFGGGQPLVMFKYACQRAGIDFDKIDVITVGGAADMDAAFRAGEGDYVQQQGPFPQQLEADGEGHVVAQVGPVVGPCAFSSLAAMPDWLETEKAAAFMRAYRKTRDYINDESAAEIAGAMASYFPKIDVVVLEQCVATYQEMGTWSRHVEITEPAYEATLDIFAYAGGLTARHAYEDVCALPPA